MASILSQYEVYFRPHEPLLFSWCLLLFSVNQFVNQVRLVSYNYFCPQMSVCLCMCMCLCVCVYPQGYE